VYRWALPADLGPLRSAIADVCDGHADILLFTNATQIHHVLQVAAEEGLESSFREAMDHLVIASIGPVASENLADCGLPVDFESKESKMGLFVRDASLECPDLLRKKRAKWKEVQGKVEVKSYPVKPYDSKACMDSPFMKACRKESVPYTPIWLMRQAGRYMKEYRDVRAKVSFLDLCKNPDLACEVTVTAQEKLGVDAAIIFSDILLILEPMGVGLEYTKGEGPYIHRPVRTLEDVEHLKPANVKKNLSFVFDAIRTTRSALKPEIPLIGFAGAPFTLASYMVEGGSGKNYLHVKTFMTQHPQAWQALMDKVVESLVEYVTAQVQAGAQAIQLFDSWVGCLSPADYRQYVFPHVKRLFTRLQTSLPERVPLIHFGTGTAGLLGIMKEAGGTVIGLDWRVDLGDAWNQVGDIAVQGNLDPAILLTDLKTIRQKVKEVLDQAHGRPGHIFNLGHGILPQTPVENVIALVDMVKEMSQQRRTSSV
jgi:uroporphyrinogen decarboxylase